MFQKPTVADLRQAAKKLGMNPSDTYLNAVEQIITPLANAYATLDTTPDELPAVKYPRGQFYRPSAEENPHGAWYVKTSIKGKPGGKLAGRCVVLIGLSVNRDGAECGPFDLHGPILVPGLRTRL